MLPVPDGSWVTGEYLQDWLSLSDREACIILTLDEGIVFKLVENHIREKGILMLYSLNPEYKPYSVNVSEVREIWKFVHYTSVELPAGDISMEVIGKTLFTIQSDIRSIKGKILQ